MSRKLIVTTLILLGTISSSLGLAAILSFGDVQSMTLRSDGKYDVICKNGTNEVATIEQIHNDEVCGGPVNHGGGVEAVFTRPEGDFFCLCKNKTWEVATAEAIKHGDVCKTEIRHDVCTTSTQSLVYFQIHGPSDAKVECFYNNLRFNGTSTYNAGTGRWSCSAWQRGNPQYTINVKVSGEDHVTDETKGLANPCHD